MSLGPYLPIAEHDELQRGQTFQPDRPTGVELIGRNANLCKRGAEEHVPATVDGGVNGHQHREQNTRRGSQKDGSLGLRQCF